MQGTGAQLLCIKLFPFREHPMRLRFADFLIIGAMKSGTSTLHRDLQSNRQIFFPVDKEPNNLADEEFLTDEGKKKYAAIFSKQNPINCVGMPQPPMRSCLQ